MDLSDESLYTAWVSGNFLKGGQDGVAWLNSYVSESGRSNEVLDIILLQGPIGSSAREPRTKGVTEGLAGNSHYNLLAKQIGEFTHAKGQEVNLCPNIAVAENIFIGSHPLNRLGGIKWKEMNKRAIEVLSVVGHEDIDVTKSLGEYSVAIQQMVAIARAVDFNCNVLLLDEPTRENDVGTKTEIQKLILKLADLGMTIMFISSEIDEMLRTVNRLCVMWDGQKVEELENNHLDQHDVMAAIAEGEK